MNNNSYSWSLSTLEWIDDFEGAVFSQSGITQKNVNFKFPFNFTFFGEVYNNASVSSYRLISFEERKNITSNEKCNLIFGELNIKGCSPLISAIGSHLLGPSKMYIKNNSQAVVITIIGENNPNMPFIESQVQFVLLKEGTIKISYKKVRISLLDRAIVGLHAGKGLEDEITNFSQFIDGESAKQFPIGILQIFSIPSFQESQLKKIIYNKYPQRYFDYILLITDFSVAVDVDSNNIVSSTGAYSDVSFNDVSGTGLAIMNCTNCSKIKALINLNNGLDIDLSNKEGEMKSILHEVAHRYAVFFNSHSPSTLCVDGNYTNLRCHLTIPLKAAWNTSCMSIMYDSSQKYPCYGYSYAELYLMGIVSKSEVLPLEDKKVVDYIISQKGPRTPTSQNSQKTFNVLPVIVTYRSAGQFRKEGTLFKKIFREELNNLGSRFNRDTLGKGKIVFNDWGSSSSYSTTN